MTKSQFKKDYSLYRKNVANNLGFGLDAFSSAMDSILCLEALNFQGMKNLYQLKFIYT